MDDVLEKRNNSKYEVAIGMLAERLVYGGGNDCPSFKGYVTKCYIEEGGQPTPSFEKCKQCVMGGIEHHIKDS